MRELTTMRKGTASGPFHPPENRGKRPKWSLLAQTMKGEDPLISLRGKARRL